MADYTRSLNNLAGAFEAAKNMAGALDLWQEVKDLGEKHSPLPTVEKLELRMKAILMSACLLRELGRRPEALAKLGAGEIVLVEMDQEGFPKRHFFRA